jgi:hypothetical protein
VQIGVSPSHTLELLKKWDFGTCTANKKWDFGIFATYKIWDFGIIV